MNYLEWPRNSEVSRGRSHPHVHPFSPKFGVRESAQSYELRGGLPRTMQEDIDIEFAGNDSNAQLLKGRSRTGTWL